MKKITSRRKCNSSDLTSFSPIDNDNWGYKCDSKVEFDIKHDENNIYLFYKVNERNTKAVYKEINEAVWNDSCVEFFISFDDEKYYNLEFNCIGNVLGEYGADKAKRERLSPELLKRIITLPSLGRNKIEIIDRPTEWTLDIVIPKEIFCFDQIETFNNITAKGNFYKCGDEQIVPHFLSWNPIGSKEPNFHLPEYFGSIEFE